MPDQLDFEPLPYVVPVGLAFFAWWGSGNYYAPAGTMAAAGILFGALSVHLFQWSHKK